MDGGTYADRSQFHIIKTPIEIQKKYIERKEGRGIIDRDSRSIYVLRLCDRQVADKPQDNFTIHSF